MKARTIVATSMMAVTLIGGSAISTGTAHAQRSAASQRPRPHVDSPLASDGVIVYAVGADKQTLLESTLSKGGSDWQAFARLDGADIRGLAWYRGRLFASDAKGPAIYAVMTEGKNSQPTLVYKGQPLEEPGELALMGDLIVVDGGAKALFRITLDPVKPSLHPVQSEVEVHKDTSIAAWGGELLMSDADTGRISVVTGLRSSAGPKFWKMQQRVEASEPYVERSDDAKSRVPSLTRATSPAVQHPASMAVYNSIVYIVDSETKHLFAATTADARTVRLQLPGIAGMEPSRLLATATELIVFDGKSGRLHRSSRPIPTEIRFAERPTAATLGPLHDYLFKRGMLPTRRETYPANLDELLTTERLSKPIFCALNPDACVSGTPRSAPSSGTIAVPDLYAERAITVTRVTLDGTKSLGEIVDENVVDSRFTQARREEHLRQINGYKGEGSIRDMRSGAFRVPKEQVRLLAAFDIKDLKGENPDFQQFTQSVRETMRFLSLERVVSSTAGVVSTPVSRESHASEEQHPNDPNCVKARDAFARLLATIGHAVPKTTVRDVSVGIAERKFDAAHRDFTVPNGSVFNPSPSDERCIAAADDPPIDPSGPGTAEPVTWRKLGRCDHGTAVASLLGARSRPFDATPLLPNAQLVPMYWEDPRLSQDIDRAMNSSHPTVFNLSLKLGAESDPLLEAIDTYDDATFVVAAGNDARPLCKPGGRFYPACWGDKNNVIVVGGTSLDGQSIQPLSNTGEHVHIVAPAADYYGAGANNAYGVLEGNSFATALVSATAAMLSAMGVERPALIKQRILATAEIDSRLPEWARRLNVSRAISHPHHAVLIKDRKPKVVALDQLGQDLAFMLDRGGDKLPLTVGQIRRLVRDPRDRTKFMVAYADSTNEQLKFVRVRSARPSWPFFYKELDADGAPTGSAIEGDLNEWDDYVGPIGK